MMVEITMLTDSLARIGLTPADVAALGAAMTAAAAAGLICKEALNRINMSTDERIRKAEAETAQMKAVSDEAQQWSTIVVSIAEKITAGIVTGGYSTVLSAQRPVDD